MTKFYAVTVNDASKNAEEIAFWKRAGYEILTLPDDMVLAVPAEATEDIKIAAQEAQDGNYDSLMYAIGFDENAELED